MSALGTQRQVEEYARERVYHTDDCIDIYYRASDDTWIAVAPGSDIPTGAAFFGSWQCKGNNIVFSSSKCG
jgi:putative sterol carrier protein